MIGELVNKVSKYAAVPLAVAALASCGREKPAPTHVPSASIPAYIPQPVCDWGSKDITVTSITSLHDMDVVLSPEGCSRIVFRRADVFPLGFFGKSDYDDLKTAVSLAAPLTLVPNHPCLSDGPSSSLLRVTLGGDTSGNLLCVTQGDSSQQQELAKTAKAIADRLG